MSRSMAGNFFGKRRDDVDVTIDSMGGEAVRAQRLASELKNEKSSLDSQLRQLGDICRRQRCTINDLTEKQRELRERERGLQASVTQLAAQQQQLAHLTQQRKKRRADIELLKEQAVKEFVESALEVAAELREMDALEADSEAQESEVMRAAREEVESLQAAVQGLQLTEDTSDVSNDIAALDQFREFVQKINSKMASNKPRN
ncbi:uncharacterized protein LOC108674659 [Hyalella azteca]|uniref:Uncharacterized protein LOC108674659 n=1 Tax=Hyalella azteca TaxID=294128 RepID=A0A8B7NWE5_HYAAZ|nr:uncharacterized protein LOC108674659 [Hyalella azteca]XP_047737374.1 uncharacterized protein LOC108674659 [Hyalella azteca]